MKKIFFTLFFSVLVAGHIPFKSFSQNETIIFASDGYSMFGTLSLPPEEENPPVIVLIHGSGPSDRNQSIPMTGSNTACLYPELQNKILKPFEDLAEDLKDQGIATFRYDKRTYTHPNRIDLKKLSPADFINDALQAVDVVKKRHDIDRNNVFVLGMSQGGNFAPVVAQKDTSIRGVISMAAPARPIDSLTAWQVKNIHYQCGDPADGDEQEAVILDVMQDVRNGTADSNTLIMGAYPPFWYDWIRLTDTTIADFEAMQAPGLFLQGDTDFNVPHTDNHAKFQEHLTDERFSFHLFEGVNHFFTLMDDPKVPYSVSETIAGWISDEKYPTPITAPETEKKLSISHSANHIRVQYTGAIQKINIFDLQGREIFTENTGKEVSFLPRDHFHDGHFYIMKVTTKEGVISRNFVIPE